MGGRKPWPFVVTAVVTFLVFVGISWPRPIDRAVISVPQGRASGYLDTVPVLPAPTTTIPATPDTTVAPEPPPTEAVPVGNGRTLRVGFAGAAASPATVADAIGSRVGLYSEPGQAEPDDWADNPTWEGLPGVYLVHEQRGDWLRVQVSMRPNQATAWIRASEVRTRTVTSHIVIDTGSKTLTIYDRGKVVQQSSVAPGRGDTPTPTGEFFVDGFVRLLDDSGPYGAYQVSVSAFSNVYYSFGSGNGQIAIHGTNDPALIGTPASHGCVRMTNEDITDLVSRVELGTPVSIL